MIDKPTFELERRRLLRAAREYRKRGYNVILEPNGVDLPQFLAGTRPDMIAKGSAENVVLEVRSNRTIRGDEQIPRIARAVKGHSDWRFELLVTNPRDNNAPLSDEDIPSESELHARIQGVGELIDRRFVEAAISLAWSACEGALRLTGKKEGLYGDDQPPAYMIKMLVYQGILDHSDYQVLDRGLKLRNSLVHGFKIRESEAEFVRKLSKVAQNLLNETSNRPV